jgi:hypothetical protein
MDSILKFPVIPELIYVEYRKLKKTPVSNYDTLKKLITGLVKDAKSNDTISSKFAKLILFDWKNYINHPAIFKEKSTASALENRIALLGHGNTSDALPKKDPLISILLSQKEYDKLPLEVQAKICSNFREKGDAIFYDSKLNSSYKVSIKSLISDNKEINFGAFEFASIIRGILPDEFLGLGERRSKINKIIGDIEYEIGRGSRQQLGKFFDYIKAIGKWQMFLERWKIVFSGIFKEDVIIYIKEHEKLKLYLISNNSFVDCVYASLVNTENGYSNMIINRWEGNSIRLDRDLLLKHVDYKVEESFDNFFDENSIKIKMQEMENIKYKKLTQD